MGKRIAAMFVMLFVSMTMTASAAGIPMLQRYVKDVNPWEYGKMGKHFMGYIPALGNKVSNNPWKLYQWKGIFNFADGKQQTINNYDVFAVKEKPGDPEFSDKNGFGLTYMSEEAVGELFDAVWSGHMPNISQKQKQFFRDTFIERGTDYGEDHEYFYKIEDWFYFLRTAGIVNRMGIKFNQAEKQTEKQAEKQTEKKGPEGHAYFTVSAWPTVKVTQGDALNISFTASGYSERDIRLVAAPKGAFLDDLSKVVSLTGGKFINTSVEDYSGSIQINAKEISRVLGSDVDIIIDDGYGRTAIQSVKLPDAQPMMDYVPTKLTLADNGQLWVKFRYDGDNIVTKDYVNKRGIPMTASVKVRGAVAAKFSFPSMDDKLPATLKSGQQMDYMLGKIEISDAPGKYNVTVDATINNPDHPDRALESPSEAYKNNTIHEEWLIERKAPENDLIAQSITASPSAQTKGKSSTMTAKVKNVGATDLSNVLIRFVQDGKKTIYETRKTMPVNTPITVGPFKWSGDVGIHTLSVHVDPAKEKPDKDRLNNVATTGCTVSKSVRNDSSNNGGGRCNAQKTGKWNVTYSLITGYPTKTKTVTWTSSKGIKRKSKKTYTDYSDPIWEHRTVTYNELLTVSAKLDTKQGIPTDKENPKEEDRESRGSWEIIPWAEENGLNPNEVTRAGYGIEIKVQTKYTTDWETKVPKGLKRTAKPIGGPKLKGPTEVRVSIWDTNDDYVTSLDLVKTGGGDKSATWELPEEHFKSKFLDIYERKFYTDIHAPDGEYTFEIVAMHAGQNDLSSCVTKKITIYGSMYDDWQTKRDTSEWFN